LRKTLLPHCFGHYDNTHDNAVRAVLPDTLKSRSLFCGGNQLPAILRDEVEFRRNAKNEVARRVIEDIFGRLHLRYRSVSDNRYENRHTNDRRTHKT
jgi:hypothetical protein